jgi:hypothetical protein
MKERRRGGGHAAYKCTREALAKREEVKGKLLVDDGAV